MYNSHTSYHVQVYSVYTCMYSYMYCMHVLHTCTTCMYYTLFCLQVSNLFENQEDLLSEFGQFLPDATASFGASFMGPPPTKKPALSSSGGGKGSKPVHSRKASQVRGGVVMVDVCTSVLKRYTRTLCTFNICATSPPHTHHTPPTHTHPPHTHTPHTHTHTHTEWEYFLRGRW